MNDSRISHYATESVAYKKEPNDDTSFIACKWDDNDACNFVSTVYLIMCPANWQDDEPDEYDKCWDDKIESCEISGDNRGIVEALSVRMRNHYPDVIEIDNDYY